VNHKFASKIFALGLLLASCAAWAAPVVKYTQVVVPVTPAETLTISPTTVNQGTAVQFVAQISGVHAAAPTGTVKYAILGAASPNSTTPNIVATSDAIPMIAGQTSWTSTPPVGSYTVTANYSGDANYNPTSATASGIVLGADFDFQAPAANVLQGQSMTENVSVSSINGFSGPVSFSCVPTGNFSCSFPTATYHVVAAAGGATANNVAPQTLPLTVNGYPGQFVAGSSLFLMFLGLGARRRHKYAAALPILIAGLGLLALSGCGGGSNAAWQSITEKGTHQATIIGTSGSLQHSKTITVTVQ
jgi:hypothetical protein